MVCRCVVESASIYKRLGVFTVPMLKCAAHGGPRLDPFHHSSRQDSRPFGGMSLMKVLFCMALPALAGPPRGTCQDPPAVDTARAYHGWQEWRYPSSVRNTMRGLFRAWDHRFASTRISKAFFPNMTRVERAMHIVKDMFAHKKRYDGNFEVEGYDKDEIIWQRLSSTYWNWGHHLRFFADITKPRDRSINVSLCKDQDPNSPGEGMDCIHLPGAPGWDAAFEISSHMHDKWAYDLAEFHLAFGLDWAAFRSAHVLDIGVWTGATSFAIGGALQAREVVSVEEVQKYAMFVRYVRDVFELPVRVLNQSLYDLEQAELAGVFDIVYFPGVLYHLSDPLVAVRILYNRLKLGGLLLVETMCDKDDVDDIDPSGLYTSDDSAWTVQHGSHAGRVTYHGASAQWNNHYAHSPKALVMLLHDAGFNGHGEHSRSQLFFIC